MSKDGTESRFFAIFASLLFSAAFLYLNLDGYSTLCVSFPPTKLPDLEFYFGETSNSQYTELNKHVQRSIGRQDANIIQINWLHGWPFQFAARPSMYSIAKGKGVPMTSIKPGDSGYYSRWPIDNAPPFWFLYQPLIANITVFLIGIVAIWLSTAGLNMRPRFTIAGLMILIAVVALIVRFRLLNLRFTPHVVAWSVIAVGLVLSVTSITNRLIRGRNDE